MIHTSPPVSGTYKGTACTSHAISRSAELLSCARTALRIAQQENQFQLQDQGGRGSTFQIQKHAQLPDELLSINPDQLKLHVSSSQSSNSASHPSLNELHTSKSSNSDSSSPSNPATEALHEATDTLQQIDKTLSQISNLVKQRLITNDPTHSINAAMAQFHKDTKELVEILDTVLPRAALIPINGKGSTQMRKQHYERIASVLKGMMEERGKRFKEIMQVRGKVLKEMALEKDQLFRSERNASGKNDPHHVGLSGNSIGSTVGVKPLRNARIVKPVAKLPRMKMNGTKSQLNSPLFNVSAPSKTMPISLHKSSLPPTSSGTITQPTNASGSAYGKNKISINGSNGIGQTYEGGLGSSSSSSGYGYGGTVYNGASSTGMRRRGGVVNSNDSASYGGYGSTNNHPTGASKPYDAYNPYGHEHEESNKGHGDVGMTVEQVKARRHKRQTANRLEVARQAEKSLAELTSMFGKMSTLIASQSEIVEKIEDEVGIAMGHVDDGADEITKLYKMTEGNRALIFKVFGILIFFIVFMKWYG